MRALLLAALLAAGLIAPLEAGALAKGDLQCASGPPCTGDGAVTPADLWLALDWWRGGAAFAPEQEAAADVWPLGGGDAQVTTADLWVLARVALLAEDADGDGVIEGDATLDAFSPDTDGDGLWDGATVCNGGVCQVGELTAGTDPRKVDTDGDGLCDGDDRGLQTDPSNAAGCRYGEDLDLDGVVDVDETSAQDPDTDNDGICDGPHAAATLPDDGATCSGAEDADQDGFDPGETRPTLADSDGDTRCDGASPRVYDAAGNRLCTGSELAPPVQSCTNCFAFFIMPDTQAYTLSPAGRSHLQLMARYLCDERPEWVEPSTGKAMPLAMVVQLGDITQNNLEPEWSAVDAAFDLLDGCGMPYIVVNGNHDGSPYSTTMYLYQKYFGTPCDPAPAGQPPRACQAAPFAALGARAGWAQHRCLTGASCTPQEWFVGGGDDIGEASRDLDTGNPGPPTDEPGRHRVAVVGRPDGGQMLFVGLEMGFDFANPTLSPPLRDDLAWIEGVLAQFPDVPTVLVNHAMFMGDNDVFPAGVSLGADTWSAPQEVWNRLVDPHPQIFMTVNGHWISNTANHHVETTSQQADVVSVFRNFQTTGYLGLGYGDGWNTIAVVDPDQGQLRLRSYRIDDVDSYRTRWMTQRGMPASLDHSHDGVLEETGALDRDYECGTNPEACEVVLPWAP
jgi:hypothetical protein